MKKLYVLSAILLLSGLASAQKVSDMVRFSTTTNTGSARSAGMGGAFGALGGDLSSVGINPAGIGVFRRTEFSITPYWDVAKTKSMAKNDSDDRMVNRASYLLGTLGGVIAFHNQNSNWRGFNIGINYNNLNNFNRTTSQYVNNSRTSFTEIWASEANDNGVRGRGEMAVNTGLITLNEETGLYEPTLLPGEEVNQRKYTREDGYQGQYDLAFGANYKDKLYLGITVGVQSIHYKVETVFRGKGDEINFFGLDNYDFAQYQKIKGIGTNVKFGFIYCPIPELRLGGAIHTATFYSMTDDYSEEMNAVFYEPDGDGNYAYSGSLVLGSYDYDMQTPWRAVFSAATVLMQKVTCSFDYEYSDYGSSQFSGGEDGEDYHDADDSGVNDQIRSELRATHNFRAGAAYQVDSTFSFRGGYSYWASPYKIGSMPTILKSNSQIQAISLGFGVNAGRFFFDAAYVYKFSKNITNFYYKEDPSDSAYDIIATPINNKYISHEGCVTVGVRF